MKELAHLLLVQFRSTNFKEKRQGKTRSNDYILSDKRRHRSNDYTELFLFLIYEAKVWQIERDDRLGPGAKTINHQFLCTPLHGAPGIVLKPVDFGKASSG